MHLLSWIKQKVLFIRSGHIFLSFCSTLTAINMCFSWASPSSFLKKWRWLGHKSCWKCGKFQANTEDPYDFSRHLELPTGREWPQWGGYFSNGRWLSQWCSLRNHFLWPFSVLLWQYSQFPNGPCWESRIICWLTLRISEVCGEICCVYEEERCSLCGGEAAPCRGCSFWGPHCLFWQIYWFEVGWTYFCTWVGNADWEWLCCYGPSQSIIVGDDVFWAPRCLSWHFCSYAWLFNEFFKITM